MEQLLITLVTLLSPPLLALVLLVICLATFGTSLGIRRRYVQYLLEIFEWGSKQARRNRPVSTSSDAAAPLSANDEGGDREIDAAVHASFDVNSISQGIIKREASDRIMEKLQTRKQSMHSRPEMVVDDGFDFLKAGIEAVIDDDVTSRFLAEELVSWNLLTRTSSFSIGSSHFFSWQLTLLYLGGLVFRYCVLFPIRLILMVIGLGFLISGTAIIGYLQDGRLKEWLNSQAMLVSCRILSRALSAIITFHNSEHVAGNGGICVANHTSPIDVVILNCDNSYALIGQKQGGLLGVVQRALNRASSHIWFERSEVGDRAAVARRIRDHVQSPDTMPILIFPEGTCINNTSVMMFKKGSFEVGATIHPAAMKYDPRFCDPFWNSSQQSWGEYMIRMMTSWALVVDVWYLPPMTQQPDEDSIQFANRCKKVIAEQGGLIDLEWDGGLKRTRVPEKMIARQQKLYSQRLSRAASAQGSSFSSSAANSPRAPDVHELLDEAFEDETPTIDAVPATAEFDNDFTSTPPPTKKLIGDGATVRQSVDEVLKEEDEEEDQPMINGNAVETPISTPQAFTVLKKDN